MVEDCKFLAFQEKKTTPYYSMLLCLIKKLPYGTKILHGIKFYGFTVVGTTVKLKSVKFYYYIAKILSRFDNRKI